MRTAQLRPTLSALTLGAAVGLASPLAQSRAVEVRDVEEIWVEPRDLESRDLFRGPADGPPPPDATRAFTFVKRDSSGRSPGYDVRDDNGVVWSVKLGIEAQSEVAASRILWAIGFHQPPTYYVGEWTLAGDKAGRQAGGRFRPKLSDRRSIGDWKWDDNPFSGTRPLARLLAAQMMINNWDLKASNNKIYEVSTHLGPRRQFVVRDLGASLGYNEQSKWLHWLGGRGAQGSKNDLEGFEKSEFIDKVQGPRIVFSYRGPHEPLLAIVTTADVPWLCELLARLSDAQWRDAFRAGGYTEEQSTRYIAKFKKRIAQGLALK